MSFEQTLQEQVEAAAASGTALSIQGGDSKSFYGRMPRGEVLSVSQHKGIIDYTPSELVISARAGTTLTELESVLEQEGQMLAFEPAHFGDNATLGGTIACGLSGPRRPYAGAARDFVLGLNCVNGKGEWLRFGGQVMKNVAGYDVSRTLTGSLGTLAIMLDIHLRVLPRPETEVTLQQACDTATAIQRCNALAAQPLPVSASCYTDGRLTLRLSGMEQGVQSAAASIGGEALADAARFWQQLREHQSAFFSGEQPLWRLSVPPATAPLPLEGDILLDWGGAQRWLRSEQAADTIRSITAAAGGHATLFRGGDRDGEVFQPLQPALLSLHQRLKQSFDPAGILNPGRMYREL
ncbi:MAG: glycolate oxidase subunit GlcE [Gammaproteobacteria bacterium]|jgi:glycolate oxidase FAD binding subunit